MVRFWNSTAFLESDQLLPIARATDEAEFAGIAIPDHLFFARDLRSPYPYTPDGTPGWGPDTPWPDPWVTIAAFAAVTRHLEFTTNIYGAPARDVFTVAKQVATASVLSGGRVALGVGAGWCEEEFVQTGHDFGTRGKRLDEMLPALRSLWQGGYREFHGDHLDFGEVATSPTPASVPPIYVGGDSPAALRRAATLGDGWIGTLYTEDQAAEKLDDLHRALDAAGRDPSGFRVFLSLLVRDDPDTFARWGERGVTDIIHAPWLLATDASGQPTTDLATRVEALHRFADAIITPLS